MRKRLEKETEMTSEQIEKRLAFANALKAAIAASEGVMQDGWDTPISYIVDAMRRGVRDYGRNGNGK